MSVMNSPADLRARDDHVRLLLDQRAARADLHGRFPSLSEFSDSPSVYSHPHFSPRPSDRSVLDGSIQPFRFPQSPQFNSPLLPAPRSPITDRERLNIPTASSLDLEDDPRSSSEYNSLHDEDDSSPDEATEEEIPRVSMYGPKMRFHSPAPWEEEGEEELARESIDDSSKRSKSKKGWGLSKGNSEPRPSTDSARSGRPKQSFETTSSTLSAGGALAALAQASMSTTSLHITPSPQSLRDKLSLPRLRSRTPSNVGQMDALSNSTNASPISRITSPTDVDADHRSLAHASTRSATPQYAEYTHPYANPDLVRAATSDQPLSSPSLHASFGTQRSESNATLTDTTPSSSMSQFRSTTTLSITPGTSMTSVNPSLSDSTSSSKVGGRGISGPMPLDKSSLPFATLNMLGGVPQSPVLPAPPMSPGPRSREHTMSGTPMGGIPAWQETGSGGALKLISLEEAQAQARERSRSATGHPAISSPYGNSSRTHIPDPDSDGSLRAQGRARSTSAGASKARHTQGDSPVSGGPHKQVVRKKSGFMRLFNGKDRDRISPSSPPPPVPSLIPSDAFAANPAPPQPPSTHYARSRQGSTHRVPVPSLSPSMLGEPYAGSGGSAGSGSGSGSMSSSESPPASTGSSASTTPNPAREQHITARRKVPELSIVTSAPTTNLGTTKVPYTAPLSAGAKNDVSQHLTPTTAVSRQENAPKGSLPSSAPPSKTDFVGLSIRPVSTLFSRELKEQLSVADDASLRTRPSLEVDTGTPTTATTAISPLSPDFPSSTKSLGYGRSSDEKSGPVITQDERDQSGVIQALQEQILTARRAWQRQIWELEGQVRDLKAEVEELRAAEGSNEYCAACGRGSARRPGSDDARNLEELQKAGVRTGVVNRPRARTGVGSRFASGT